MNSTSRFNNLTADSILSMTSSVDNASLTQVTTKATISETAEEPEGIMDEERILTIVLVVAGSLAVILDVIMLILMITRIKKKTNQLYLIMNLLVCDVLIGCSAIVIGGTWLKRPFYLGTANTNDAQILDRRLQCAGTIMESFWSVGTYANLFGLTLMTVDYLIAVFWSLKHATVMTKRWIFIGVSVAWIIAFVLGFVPIMLKSQMHNSQIILNYETKGTTYFCYQSLIYDYVLPDADTHYFDLNQTIHFKANVTADLIIILVVFVFIVAVYSAIISVIIKAEKARRRLTYVNSSTSTPRLSQRIRRGVVTSGCFIIGFVLVWFPLNAYYIRQIMYEKSGDAKYLYRVFLLITSCTGLVDVIIYVIRNKDTMKTIFRDTTTQLSTSGHRSLSNNTMKTTSTVT